MLGSFSSCASIYAIAARQSASDSAGLLVVVHTSRRITSSVLLCTREVAADKSLLDDVQLIDTAVVIIRVLKACSSTLQPT